jgi:predicted  nucleic acid-binding Zn-ribbon protein
VVRRLAGPDSSPGPDIPPAAAEPDRPGAAALRETVASLEQKLASVTSRQRRLAEENSRLREQLRAAEQSLAEAQERVSAEALAGRFDSAEVRLLERLLSPLREERRRQTEADAG